MLFKLLIIMSILSFSDSYAKILRPVEGQSTKCVELKFETSGEFVENHPQGKVPTVITLLNDGVVKKFEYKSWYRSLDSLVSVFSAKGEGQILFDSFCMKELNSFACWKYKSCLYVE